ncbi:MAG: alpha/beta fold hydrolase [Candidatus Binatus sp.]
MSLISEVTGYIADGAIHALDAYRSGFGAPENDPPPATPSTVIYEGGMVKLRYYAARGIVRHHTPLLLVYALIKRPFILDLQPGRSVIEVLVNQGFDLYLIDWIPPGPEDSWRGFDAYANRDVANAARAVRMHHGDGQISVLGYCFGALLALIYTALHRDEVKNLVTLTIPFDMSVRELPMTHMMDWMSVDAAETLVAIHGNVPASMINSGFLAISPIHHLLDKYVGRYRNAARPGYGEMFELFERWMTSDVPLAGQIFREVTSLGRENKLYRNQMIVGGRHADVKSIECPLLNVVAELDDVVHPKASLPLPDFVSSQDRRNLTFPTGHIGAAVSGPALQKLWPEISRWLSEHD